MVEIMLIKSHTPINIKSNAQLADNQLYRNFTHREASSTPVIIMRSFVIVKETIQNLRFVHPLPVRPELLFAWLLPDAVQQAPFRYTHG